MRDKVSGAIAIPKASWGCAPALPNLLQLVFLGIMFHVKQCIKTSCFLDNWLQILSRRQIKSFLIQQFFKNVGEVLASSPRLRSKFDFAICFPCCNCIFKSCSIQIKLNHEKQDCKFRPGNGTIAACWQAKAGVEPPFAGR